MAYVFKIILLLQIGYLLQFFPCSLIMVQALFTNTYIFHYLARDVNSGGQTLIFQSTLFDQSSF